MRLTFKGESDATISKDYVCVCSKGSFFCFDALPNGQWVSGTDYFRVRALQTLNPNGTDFSGQILGQNPKP